MNFLTDTGRTGMHVLWGHSLVLQKILRSLSCMTVNFLSLAFLGIELSSNISNLTRNIREIRQHCHYVDNPRADLGDFNFKNFPGEG